MKRTRLLYFLVPAFLLAVAFIVLRPPRPTLTIRAIGSTGDTWYRKAPQPIWRFVISNASRSTVEWQADVGVKGGADKSYDHTGGFIDWPQGVLVPGQSTETNMIVPAVPGSVWRGTVRYHREMTRVEEKLWHWGVNRVPLLWRFLPYRSWFESAGDWHQTPDNAAAPGDRLGTLPVTTNLPAVR